jgi:hypothetical protein
MFQAMNLDMPDDAAAIAAAQQLVDGHDVELWQRDRKIAKFDHNLADRSIRKELFREAP